MRTYAEEATIPVTVQLTLPPHPTVHYEAPGVHPELLPGQEAQREGGRYLPTYLLLPRGCPLSYPYVGPTFRPP
jgi:hypothetical protein